MTRMLMTRREALGQVIRGGGAGLLGRALPLGAAAVLAWPRKAYAAVVLDPNAPIPPFSVEPPGSLQYTPGTVLGLNDLPNEIVNFYAPDSDAAAGGPDLDMVTTFQVQADTGHAGDEIGVRFVIDEGVEKRVVAACIVKGGLPGIGLAQGDNLLTDANSYPAFVPVNWKGVTSFRVRRTNEGAEIMEVNGVAPATRQFVAHSDLPTRHRPTPTVEFGCPSVEAAVSVTIHAFLTETPVLPVSIKIKPGSEEASINLGSAGVIPVAILSSPTFDATQVDPATVSLAGAAVRLIGKGNRYSATFADVNGDGRLDLLCHVETADFLLEAGESLAVLEAETFAGQKVRGQETVRIVP